MHRLPEHEILVHKTRENLLLNHERDLHDGGTHIIDTSEPHVDLERATRIRIQINLNCPANHENVIGECDKCIEVPKGETPRISEEFYTT